MDNHQEWAYATLPPAGFKPKSAVDTSCQSARCSIYFLGAVLTIGLQVCVALAIYQVFVLGPFVPIRCHITSRSIVAEMECDTQEILVSGDFEAQGLPYSFEQEPISVTRFNKLLVVDDDAEHSVGVNLTIHVGLLEVRDTEKRVHDTTTCFLREDVLYIDATHIYTVMSNMLYAFALCELIFLVCCCCGVKKMMFFNPYVLLRALCFCGRNDTSRQRIQPDTQW